MRKSRLLKVLAMVGPGLVAANAGNDAGGIATYSQAGAGYGYDLLWAMLLITFGVAIVQEMAARMGAVTGKGLSDLIRESFGVRWTLVAVAAILVANGFTVIADFAGVGASLHLLFGLPNYLTIPLIALFLWVLVTRGSYNVVERVFLAMSLVFFGYIASALLAHPNWSAVVRGTFVPKLETNSGYLWMLVALIGTTISPYMQLFIQSAVAEKGMKMRDYPFERLDVYLGSAFACSIAFFIIISTGAALPRGTEINSAAEAAQALAPLAKGFASTLFSIGLFGASMLAAGVLPLATAYAVSEAFGFERGVSRSVEEAPFFTGLFTVILVVAAAVTLIPGINPIKLMIFSQVVQGILLPVILFFILRLVNDRDLMGPYVNSWRFNVAAWTTTILVSILSLLMLGVTLLQLLGIKV